MWVCPSPQGEGCARPGFAVRLGYPQQSHGARPSAPGCRAACPAGGCLPVAISGCSCFLFLGLQMLVCTRAGFLHPLTLPGLGLPSRRTLPSCASNKLAAWWEVSVTAPCPFGEARLGQGGRFHGQQGSCLSLPNHPPAPQHLGGLSCGPVRSRPALHGHRHGMEAAVALGTGCAYSCSEFCWFSACGSRTSQKSPHPGGSWEQARPRSPVLQADLVGRRVGAGGCSHLKVGHCLAGCCAGAGACAGACADAWSIPGLVCHSEETGCPARLLGCPA